MRRAIDVSTQHLIRGSAVQHLRKLESDAGCIAGVDTLQRGRALSGCAPGSSTFNRLEPRVPAPGLEWSGLAGTACSHRVRGS